MDLQSTFSFDAIGTHWQIDLYPAFPTEHFLQIQSAVLERIETYDKHYSRFRHDSLVSRMAQQAGHYTLPDDGQLLFDLYQQLYEISGGMVTPLIGDTLAAAGYDANYSFQPHEVKPAPTWQGTLEYSYPELKLKQPAIIDVGAAGKGYLTDIIGQLLQSLGVQSYTINAGGDILYLPSSAHQPLAVGLENPDAPDEAIGIAQLQQGSLCGSSGARRSWAKDTAGQPLHHIMNPSSGQSPHHIKGVWVTADTGMIADAMTTALYFVSPGELRRHWQFEYAILFPDQTISHSEAFPADFFTE